MDPARFGIRVKDPVCLERIRGILTAFFEGVECGMKRPLAATELGAAVDPVLRPFFHEGVGMGFLPNGYLAFSPARSSLRRLEDVFHEGDPFLFLRYVGLGFWLGFQHPREVDRVDSVVRSLRGHKYRHLVHDGYGFKVGFFDSHPMEPSEITRFEHEIEAITQEEEDSLERGNMKLASELHRMREEAEKSLGVDKLRKLERFERASAFTGFGRSLWFYSMDRPRRGFALARFLGPDRDAVLGGMGLASAFTFVDDLSRAYTAADELSGKEKSHFSKGIAIALYVRASADLDHVRYCIERLPPGYRSRAEADLSLALKVGEETRGRDDFIEAFHEGCFRT